MAPLPVLFTHYGDDWIRGSETLLLDLLEALDKDLVRPVIWCNGTQMAAATRKAGYVTYQNEFRHSFDYSSPRPSASHFLNLVRTCRGLCQEHNIRILHANSGAPVQWLVPAGLSERLPVLAHLHIDYLRRSRYVLLLHAATLVVGVSKQVTDGFIADGMKPERTQVIYNGIDFARLKPSTGDLRTALNIPSDAFVVATAGSLITRKGHDLLIRAFHAIPPEPVLPHLLIPSGGPERESLEALAASLGIAGRVHFLGYIDDIVQVYQAADVFALASRGDAFGLVLAEAGYFGLPVVSTRVGGIPEVILHEQTGLLTLPDDVPAFSGALARLMVDRELRAQLGTKAAERVREVFTVEQMARQFEKTYAALAATPSSQLGWGAMLRGLRPYARLIRLPDGRPKARYET